MEIICNICKTKYNLNSEKAVETFCKHVSKCPLRADNEFQERFSCSICKTTFELRKSFAKHILREHLDSSNQNCESQTEIKRERIGKYYYYYF